MSSPIVSQAATVQIARINVERLLVPIRGTSPLIVHKFSQKAKQQMLGVPSELILAHGAVSAEVVAAMAAGALAHSTAQLSVAISGIAGPLGGTPEKPVGTVWMGWARSGGEEPIRTRCFQFAGDRHQVREQAIVMALQGMCEFIQ